MNYKKTEIKNGINLHTIRTNKFKTNIISIFLTTSLKRDNVTKNALIPAVLRLGTNNIKTQKDLNKKLEEMYGANFNCGVEKRGDNQVLKFYIESIDDEFALNNEDILEQSINLLIDIVFNPLTEDGAFNERYVNGEKENLKKIIESKIDNKRVYSYIRCIEEMYRNKNFGLYEFGYTEDLKAINAKEFYEYYRNLLNECKIDIFVSGCFKENERINNIITNNAQIQELKPREAEFIHNSRENVDKVDTKKIEERMNVTQGNLVIGMSIKNSENEDAIINVYNAILGGGSNSKLFQNVREKASLAYTAGSLYLIAKNNIFIRCGIEIKNYEKANNVIKKQIEDMKNGEFTDEDIANAKQLIISSLEGIKDEQATEISYYMSQELTDNKKELEKYLVDIKAVTKSEIEAVANRILINTIYFLKN